MIGQLRNLAAALLVLAAFAVIARADEAVHDSVPMPPKTKISYYYDAFEHGFARPVARSLDPARLVRRVGRNLREAANVDEQDRVRLPSTFWQPRVGFKAVSADAMMSGPGPGSGPAPGPWSVVKAKTQGVSKGFEMKDASGARFAVKLDPAKEPEMASGADVVASKLFWAAGYNVPDNAIAYFRREDLQVGKNATHSVGGKDQPITDEFLDELLKGAPQMEDGRYRVIASRFLAGKPIGEWEFRGRHERDVEDKIPHELRRELRGLWAVSAWLNHTDCSARNTLTMYVKDGGRSFPRHHLIDFSGCLGSASIARQPLRAGHEYFADYGAMFTNLVTLGLPKSDWERSVEPDLRGVGFVDAETFDPEEWRPYLQNPAFDDATRRDIVWGAQIVAAFPDDLIEAAVRAGDYSDPAAAEYLVRILKQRRDKLAATWLTAEQIDQARATGGGRARFGAPASLAPSPTIETVRRVLDPALDLGEPPSDPFAMAAGGSDTIRLPDLTLADTLGLDSTTTPVPGAAPASASAPAPPSPTLAAPDTLANVSPPAPSGPKKPNLPTRMKNAAGHFFSDGWYILSSPARMGPRSWLTLGAVVGVEAVLYANDQAILDASVRNRDERGYRELVNVGQVVDPIGFMGNTNPYYFGAIVVGYALDIHTLRMIPAQILESHFLAGGLRNIGKYLVGRRHPYEDGNTAGPDEFDFGHGTSFPSGHTSVYFELATIGSMHIGKWPATVGLYSLAVAGAVQRVESFNHWPSDVFISAVYGTLISRTVVKRHEQREMNADAQTGFQVSPWIERDGNVAGLRIDRRF